MLLTEFVHLLETNHTTEAFHVSKHQRGRHVSTTGMWGNKCTWHNRFLCIWWQCHGGTVSVSLYQDSSYLLWSASTLHCIICLSTSLVAFLGVLEYLIDATVASACTSVYENDDDFTRADSFGCDQKQFYVPVRGRPVYITRAESTTYVLLLQLRESYQWGETVKFTYRRRN